jgi:Ser/Thr protein kinase RdoA (MazF antagonist)
MLSLADQAFLKRETALPSLSFLLDDEAATDLINETWPGLKVNSAKGCYLRYKPLTSCLVRYDVTTAQGQETIYAKAYPVSATDKFAKARATTRSDYHRAVLEKACLILYRFPDDPKLRSLRVLSEQKRQPFLQKLLPGYPDATLSLLAYKPERRAVVQASHANKKAVLKFYNGDFAKVHTIAKQIENLKSLRSPFILNTLEGHNVIALEWLEGTLLRSLLASEDVDLGQIKNVGASLATLHVHACDFPTRSLDVVSRHMQDLLEYLSWLQPALKHRLFALLEHLDFQPSKSVPLHGDFYSKQVLVQEGGIAFLDFDEAHQGPAAYDLGLFIGHLEADVLLGLLPASKLQDIKAYFLQGYEDVAALPNDIESYTISGLVSLLPHFFRNRYEHWPEMTETLLARAELLMRQNQTKTFAMSL